MSLINIVLFDEVDSTNDRARELADCDASEWTVVCAKSQTKGRGRAQRTWISDGDWGIWASLILRPKIEMALLPLVPICMAVAICESLNDDFQIKSRLKWPNDIEIDGKKVCGILAESKIQNSCMEYMVIGFGINVEVPKDGLAAEINGLATTIKEHTSAKVDRDKLLHNIIERFQKMYLALDHGDNMVVMRASQLSALLDEEVSVRLVTEYETKTLDEGRVIGLSNSGGLIIKSYVNGGIAEYGYGEVSIRRNRDR